MNIFAYTFTYVEENYDFLNFLRIRLNWGWSDA